MLTIKNIDKIINMMCFGRDIYHVRNNTNKTGHDSYVFEFDAIQDGQVPKHFNKPIEVHLMRNADADGHYELFVMGLQMATRIKVKEGRIKDKQTLILDISHVLSKAKDWWDNSNLKNKV
jgi:hypothetical protein